MKRNLKYVVGIALSAMVFSGCATIVNEKTQPITFNSVPTGATIKINGQVKGETPSTINVERGNSSIVTIEKDGYKAYTEPMETDVDGWFWGNILIGGLLGSTTDASTGKMYEYAPDSFTVELNKK